MASASSIRCAAMPIVFQGLFLAAALPAPPAGQTTFTLTPKSQASIGIIGSDRLGVEEISAKSAVVLVWPNGEDCVLRFPVEIGDSVVLRSGLSMLCQAELQSLEAGKKAKFSLRCIPSTATSERKCPSSSR